MGYMPLMLFEIECLFSAMIRYSAEFVRGRDSAPDENILDTPMPTSTSIYLIINMYIYLSTV